MKENIFCKKSRNQYKKIDPFCWASPVPNHLSWSQQLVPSYNIILSILNMHNKIKKKTIAKSFARK